MSIENKWEADTAYQFDLMERERRRAAKWNVRTLAEWHWMPITWVYRGCFDYEAAKACVRIGWREFLGRSGVTL